MAAAAFDGDADDIDRQATVRDGRDEAADQNHNESGRNLGCCSGAEDGSESTAPPLGGEGEADAAGASTAHPGTAPIGSAAAGLPPLLPSHQGSSRRERYPESHRVAPVSSPAVTRPVEAHSGVSRMASAVAGSTATGACFASATSAPHRIPARSASACVEVTHRPPATSLPSRWVFRADGRFSVPGHISIERLGPEAAAAATSFSDRSSLRRVSTTTRTASRRSPGGISLDAATGSSVRVTPFIFTMWIQCST